MEQVLEIIGWSSFGIAIVVGLLLNLLGLFGNWIFLGAMTLVWFLTDHLGPWSIVGMLVLSILGEALEMLFAGFGAKHFGGSKGSIWAAFAGVIIGGILGSGFIPVVGTLVGAIVGAFIAAALYEHLNEEKDIRTSVWTGTGAALGKIGGIAAKFGCGIAILALAFFAW